MGRVLGLYGPPFAGRPMGPKGPINFYWLAYQNVNTGAKHVLLRVFNAFIRILSGFYQVIYQAFIGLIYKVFNCSCNS
jgi:hypothetical protein